MSYLITGATGAVGRRLVDALVAADVPVRALTRTPQHADLPAGVEVVAGDLAAAETLPDSVFAGVERAFVFPAESGIDRFARRAAAAGVRRFVVLSSLAAAGEHERDRRSASNVHHVAVEAAVAATGVPATILRPGTFASNLLAWAGPIRSSATVQGPYPRSAQAPIHEVDVADVAAVALRDDGHEGATYALTGPQALTRIEQLDAIGEAIGRTLTFEEITPEAFAEQMRPYLPAPIVTMLLDYWSDTVTEPDTVRPTVERVTGRPGRTLAQWARDHADAFGGR